MSPSRFLSPLRYSLTFFFFFSLISVAHAEKRGSGATVAVLRRWLASAMLSSNVAVSPICFHATECDFARRSFKSSDLSPARVLMKKVSGYDPYPRLAGETFACGYGQLVPAVESSVNGGFSHLNSCGDSSKEEPFVLPRHNVGLPCDFNQSTCGGKNELFYGRGPGYPDEFESTRIIEDRQYRKALELFNKASEQLKGNVDYCHACLDFTHLQVPQMGLELLILNKEMIREAGSNRGAAVGSRIVECRRVLKSTYAYGYYLPAHEHAKRRFFEYLQGM